MEPLTAQLYASQDDLMFLSNRFTCSIDAHLSSIKIWSLSTCPPRNTRQMDKAPPSSWFYGTSNYAYKPHEYKAQHAAPLYWQEVSWPDAITSTWVDLACNLGYIWEVKVKVQLHPLPPTRAMLWWNIVKPEKMMWCLSATIDVLAREWFWLRVGLALVNLHPLTQKPWD